MKKSFLTICTGLFITAIALSGCSSEKGTGELERNEIIFADAGWDSGKFNNAVAGFIAKEAFGYKSWSEIPATTVVLHEALMKGEVDVHMEEWTDNLATYRADVEAGKLVELGVNFDDNMQGIYVPRYVIEGDAARNIKATAPDLKTVKDLLKYKDIFPDDEEKGQGRLYGAIPGWEVDGIMFKKFTDYGFEKDFNYFRPGSQAAMDTAFTSAYDKGVPIVGYYWEPTWLMGKYDFVLLEDEAYDENTFREGKTAFPSVEVTVAVSNNFSKKDPEFCEFLKKYHTNSALISEVLSYMQETGADHGEAVKWFLSGHSELIDEWLVPEKAQLVKDALK